MNEAKDQSNYFEKFNIFYGFWSLIKMLNSLAFLHSKLTFLVFDDCATALLYRFSLWLMEFHPISKENNMKNNNITFNGLPGTTTENNHSIIFIESFRNLRKSRAIQYRFCLFVFLNC